MKRVGVSSASMSMRDLAGWMRWPSASKSWRPCVVEQHDLAVEHVAPLGERQLGEVAGQRLAVARLQVDLVAVDERERAEAVPLRLVDPAVALGQRLLRLRELGEDGRAERQGHAPDPRLRPRGGLGRRARPGGHDASGAGAPQRTRGCATSILANAEAPYSEWRVVELRGCRLTGFDLRDSTGLHVLFEDCRADLMSLRSARIEGAIFRDCVLTGADFSGADLRGARFERCDLTEVELREARLEGATLDGCRLAGIRGALSAARDADALGRRRRARAVVRRALRSSCSRTSRRRAGSRAARPCSAELVARAGAAERR